MNFTSRIKNHPTVLILRLFVNLELFEKKNKESNGLKTDLLLRQPLLLLVVFFISVILLILYLTSKQDKQFSFTQKEVISASNEELEKYSTDTTVIVPPALGEKNSDTGIKMDSINTNEETDKVTAEIPINHLNIEKDTVQINSQRIEKLEMLLLEEQKRNKELYQKLDTQDVKLQELRSISIKDIEVGSQDQKYIKVLTENENTVILDEKKISKIDYYNKVNILLKSELGNVGNNKNIQLQNLVNKLFNTKEASGKRKDNVNYSTSLNQESGVRSNEVRSIILKKNETLWGLAKRAYGDGMLYKKIIRANPQITEFNVHFLRPGVYIRIPK